MAIQKEAKRVKMGQSLTDFDIQAINVINQLKGIKTNLTTMKASLQSDADFSQADIDEVDTIITKIDNNVGTIKGK